MSTPNQIQGGRWDEYLRSKFNLKGGAIAPEIAPEIIPVTSIPFELEDHFLLRDRLIIARAATGVTAGEFTQVSLNNPADSGIILITEGFYARSLPDLATLSITRGIFFTGAGVIQIPLDGRMPAPSQNVGTASVRKGSNAAKQGGQDIRLGVTSGQFYKFSCILAPDQSLLIQTDIVNQAIDLTFRWRESVLEPSARA